MDTTPPWAFYQLLKWVELVEAKLKLLLIQMLVLNVFALASGIG